MPLSCDLQCQLDCLTSIYDSVWTHGMLCRICFINTANSDILLMSHLFIYRLLYSKGNRHIYTGIFSHHKSCNHSAPALLQVLHLSAFWRAIPSKRILCLSGKFHSLFCTTHILWSRTLWTQTSELRRTVKRHSPAWFLLIKIKQCSLWMIGNRTENVSGNILDHIHITK